MVKVTDTLINIKNYHQKINYIKIDLVKTQNICKNHPHYGECSLMYNVNYSKL